MKMLKTPQTLPEALRLAADLAEERDTARQALVKVSSLVNEIARLVNNDLCSGYASNLPDTPENRGKMFKEAILALKGNSQRQRPTIKTLINRRPKMKEWNHIEFAEVISNLIKRGEIYIDVSKQKSAYYLTN